MYHFICEWSELEEVKKTVDVLEFVVQRGSSKTPPEFGIQLNYSLS